VYFILRREESISGLVLDEVNETEEDTGHEQEVDNANE
jgi:hypothetical protein